MKVRTWASLAGALTLVGALSGCSLFAVQQTQFPYDASDGVSATVGDVRLLNMLVFTEDGEDGNFTGAVVNTGDEDIDLVLQYQSGGEKTNVELGIPAGETLHVGGDEFGQVFLPAIDAAAGDLLKIYFQYGSTPGKQVDVPVLDDRLPEYDGLLPTPTPTPVPTVTATPEPTETPAP